MYDMFLNDGILHSGEGIKGFSSLMEAHEFFIYKTTLPYPAKLILRNTLSTHNNSVGGGVLLARQKKFKNKINQEGVARAFSNPVVGKHHWRVRSKIVPLAPPVHVFHTWRAIALVIPKNWTTGAMVYFLLHFFHSPLRARKFSGSAYTIFYAAIT